jgi:Tripartite ATP-independent periplasmic transporters, DctQ component
MDIDAGPKVMGDDGEFHATDEAVDLSGTPIEAWFSLALFWALAGVVFTQFFTRYALNDSAAWTEEIARYLLIGVVFVGASIGVAKNNHIQVDLLYRYLPAPVCRAMAIAVDVARIAFLGADGVHGADDAEDGLVPDDHRRPADEHRLQRRAVRLCGDDAALGVGGQGALAAWLQRARAARVAHG